MLQIQNCYIFQNKCKKWLRAENIDLTTLSANQVVVDSGIVVGTLDIGGTSLTATGAELNYVDGVTSNIQTQLDAKSSVTGLSSLTDGLIEDNSIYLGNDPSSTTNSALRNVSLGVNALDAITTGDDNIAIGYDALTNNTTGHDNIGVGYNVLKSNVDGAGNSAIGIGSLTSNTSGDFNTAFGNNSLKENIKPPKKLRDILKKNEFYEVLDNNLLDLEKYIISKNWFK